MEKHLKENVGIYSVGAFTALIALMGVLANTFYAETGGYGLGFALTSLALFVECFLYSFSPKIAKTRMKGALAFSVFLAIFYLALFITADLFYVQAMAFDFDGSKYVRRLMPLGTVSLVFEILSLVVLSLVSIRLFANLFGKEFHRYERLLGTDVARRSEGDISVEEFPRKDTDKLISEADRAYLSEKMTVVDLVRKDQIPSESFGKEAEIKTERIEEIPKIEQAEKDEYEQTEMALDPAYQDDVAEILPAVQEESVEIADELNMQVDGVEDDADYNQIIARNFDQGFAQDVRQDYIPSHTVQKEHEDDDDIFTDFSYGSKQDDDTPRS